MGASRKLQGEIDRVLKKVQEGVDVFDSIWNKVMFLIFPFFWFIEISYWWFCYCWEFRCTIRTMRTRRKSLRLIWRRKLRSCRGTETRLRHGFSPARSRIRRYFPYFRFLILFLQCAFFVNTAINSIIVYLLSCYVVIYRILHFVKVGSTGVIFDWTYWFVLGSF